MRQRKERENTVASGKTAPFTSQKFKNTTLFNEKKELIVKRPFPFFVVGCDAEGQVGMLEGFTNCVASPPRSCAWRAVCAPFRSLSKSTALARRRRYAPRSASRCALEDASLTQAFVTIQRSAGALRTSWNAVTREITTARAERYEQGP